MPTGAITSYIDVAQVTLYVFWFFFAGLIIYLRREDKREGYPLESDRSSQITVQGYPEIPAPKVFNLPGGGSVAIPRAHNPEPEVAAKPIGPWPGAPLEPTGDPMRDGVGPAASTLRAEIPDSNLDGHPKIVPMRVATDFHVVTPDPDPRGMDVIAADERVAGTVVDLWVDRSDPLIRYFEVEVPAAGGTRRVLLPYGFVVFRGSRERKHLKVESVLAKHFADVPGIKNPDEVTRREEDRICAYFAGGLLYAEPSRLEPLL